MAQKDGSGERFRRTVQMSGSDGPSQMDLLIGRFIKTGTKESAFCTQAAQGRTFDGNMACIYKF
jgi:hypothetical protein